MLVRIADWCYRARRLVVATWVLFLVGAFLLAGAFGGEFRQDYLQPGSESRQVSDTLDATFPKRSGDTLQIVIQAADGVDAPVARALMESVLANLSQNDRVVGVTSPFTTEGAEQISADGTIAYADVSLDKSANEYTPQEAQDLVDPVLAASTDTVQLEAGGPIATLSQTIQVGSEGIGLIAAAIILLVTFGSAVAMGLPLLTAVFGLGTAMALGEVLRRVIDVPDWAPNAAAMVGLGVGIDYALLIVTRFRSSLAEGREPRAASSAAIATAGRAVLFAGLIVVASMLGILLMGQAAMTGFAVTVILVVLVTMTASVTLLPAVLGFAGRNIERLHVPFVRKEAPVEGASHWYRWSRLVQHRPWLAATGGLAVLVVLTAPLLGIRFGTPDSSNDPMEDTTRQAFDLLEDGFGPGFSAPVIITVQGRTGEDLLTAASALAGQLSRVDGVADVAPAVVNPAGDTVLLQLVADSSPQAAVTEDLVDTLRNDIIPATTAGSGLTVGVGGSVAASMDSTRAVTDRLPLFFGGVLLLSFVLLMMVFRSVVVPLKAVVMNLLASAAAFGVLSLAVSGGWLGELVGIPEAIPVPVQLPIGIFAILFGLSMDYEVFLLSRIKEEYDRTGDNAVAVADGLAKSARVITAGAAIMVTVFLSFVLGDQVLAKMFGIGLAAAILIDATIIRMVLVPATMELLGDRNWWLPGWLDRLLPTITVEGQFTHEPDAASPTEAPTAPQPAGVNA